MGDRVSISFSDGRSESVALFSHWGGIEFAEKAKKYAQELVAERSGSIWPIDRFEPGTVMVDFIRYITDGEGRIESDLYLGKGEENGDNSDNGQHVIFVGRGTANLITA